MFAYRSIFNEENLLFVVLYFMDSQFSRKTSSADLTNGIAQAITLIKFLLEADQL